MIKSISFYSYDLNIEKYNKIKNYAILCLKQKNILSNYVYQNLLLILFHDNISKFDFIKLTKHLRLPNIHSQIYQQIQKEVYTMYMNKLNTIKIKSISPEIKYLIKTYKGNKEYLIQLIKDKYNKTKDGFFKNILNIIDDDLLEDIVKLQKEILTNIKIEFKSLTFHMVNNIGSLNKDVYMYEESDNKHTNGIINLNIQELIQIPFKYSKKYHGNLMNYKYSQNKITKQKQYTCIVQVLEKGIRIINTKEYNNIMYNYEDIKDNNTIGIDINLKHNLFTLSSNKIININKKHIEKNKRILSKQKRIQQTKQRQNKVEEKYGKKFNIILNKNSRRNKSYNEYKTNELIKYCKKHKIKNIVMEDLNLQGKLSSVNKENNIKYRQLISILHINDLKNTIKRIGNREGINVHYVNPYYTSQTCSVCGYISKDNRKTQETFSCVRCHHISNTDLNSAINIRERVLNIYLQKELEIYDKKEKMYKGKEIINKNIYQEIYNNL